MENLQQVSSSSNTINPDQSDISILNQTAAKSSEFERNFSEAQPEAGGKVIQLGEGDDIQAAIDSASDGDVIKLAQGTYTTSGLTIDKDITLDGEEGTVIDGQGADGKIITIGENADGATLQDLELTNASNGVFADGADDLLIQNLDINNIGLGELSNSGFEADNTGILVANTSGTQILNNQLSDIGRLGITVKESDGGDILIDGNSLSNINLDAQHSQAHDAGGIKLFDTAGVTISNNDFDRVNAHNLWLDTVNETEVSGNSINIDDDLFQAGSEQSGLGLMGIYNEKSYNADITNNSISALGENDFAIRSTADNFSSLTESANDFDGNVDFQSETYWAGQSADQIELERNIAISDGVWEDIASFYEAN